MPPGAALDDAAAFDEHRVRFDDVMDRRRDEDDGSAAKQTGRTEQRLPYAPLDDRVHRREHVVEQGELRAFVVDSAGECNALDLPAAEPGRLAIETRGPRPHVFVEARRAEDGLESDWVVVLEANILPGSVSGATKAQFVPDGQCGLEPGLLGSVGDRDAVARDRAAEDAQLVEQAQKQRRLAGAD